MTEQESSAWISAAVASLDGIPRPWQDATGDNQELTEEKER